MKTITLQERFATGLRALGFAEGKSTAHYRVFAKDGAPTYYLGKSGALRRSRTHRVGDAHVAHAKVRDLILTGVPTHVHRGTFYRDGVPELL